MGGAGARARSPGIRLSRVAGKAREQSLCREDTTKNPGDSRGGQQRAGTPSALWLPTRVARGKPFLSTQARVGCCHLIRKAPGHFLTIMSRASLIAALELGLVHSQRSRQHVSHLPAFLPQMLALPLILLAVGRREILAEEGRTGSDFGAPCTSWWEPGTNACPWSNPGTPGHKGAVLHLLLHSQLVAHEFFPLIFKVPVCP